MIDIDLPDTKREFNIKGLGVQEGYQVRLQENVKYIRVVVISHIHGY